MVMLSPLFALPSFGVIEIFAQQAPPIDAASQHPRPLQIIGFAMFVSMLSADTMMQSFYLTLPILAAAALALLRIRLAGAPRLLVCALGIGAVYTALFYAGLLLDFLDEPFFT